jgi:signal transduction histidine kinase
MERKVQGGFVFALALLSVIGVVSYFNIIRLREDAAWVQHTDQVIIQLELLFSAMTDAQNGHRGYAVTGDETYLEPHRLAKQTADADVRRLRELTADNPVQQRRLDLLTPLVGEQLAFGGEIIALRRSRGFEAAQKQMLAGKGKQIHDQLRGLVNEMKDAEESLLKERELRARQSTTIAQVVIIGGGGLAFGFVGLALFAIRRDFAGRRRAEENLLAAKEQLEVRVQDRTAELAQANESLEQRVVDRTAQLQTANSELEAFSYSVSHDLRAPLRHVMGFVDLLQKDAGTSLSEKSLRHLTTISLAAKRMGTLIDDLLSFSRVGRAELQKTDVNLDELVQETLNDFQAETKERNIAREIHPLPVVRCDRSLLSMVFVNLISNAVKFTGHRTDARIEVGSIPNGDNETVIFIRDNGAGFDPQYSDKLFGIFQRLHSTVEFEGTGIGLANVQRIIRRHGGRTWAEGVVDGGATFYFSIPKQNGGINGH